VEKKMEELQDVIAGMDPKEALSGIAEALKILFRDLDEESKSQFLLALVGDSEGDKLSSMVHLWLAECMGEGVDPTEMCRSLVDKVAQSKQLRAIADPELLVLFEDWLEELEAELIRRLQSDESQGEEEIAERLGLSRRGAHFLLSKLKREGRITTR
jgi:hypothetical protein